jgi:hypothetical protein
MSPNAKKILKLIAVLFGLFVAFILVAAFIVNNKYAVERSVIIDQPKEIVFDYVLSLKNQDNYSVWATLDPDMHQEFRGTDGTVGFVSAWEGNSDVGKGEQEIVNIVDGERIDYEIRFIEPFEGEADAYMITEPVSDNQTMVIWGFESQMPRPMNLMLLFMNMEDLIGADYEAGLANLKAILENQ